MPKSLAVEHVDTLLALYDEQFVVRAYEVLLCRAPDSGGLHNYLSQIRKGIAKGQILSEIAQSEEGRLRAVEVVGLSRVIKEHKRRHASVWQWVVRRLLKGVVSNTEQQLRALENRFFLLEKAIDAQSKLLTTILALNRGGMGQADISSASQRNSSNELSTTALRSLIPPVRRNYSDLLSAIAVARKDRS